MSRRKRSASTGASDAAGRAARQAWAPAVRQRVVHAVVERERRAAATRITITRPGVVRAFDAMHVRTTHGRRYLLTASDGAIPYRTSCVPAARYTGRAVARVLADDFARHGAPLVCRLDRARRHDTAAVQDVFRQYHVCVLHGPPHYPRFYGQLERQHREHRQWLETHEPPSPAALGALGEDMQRLCNTRWRRRTLGWRTADEAWHERAALTEDRATFYDEVQHRAVRLRRQLAGRGLPADLPERLAIEQTLTTRGYLRRVSGGWC